MKKFNQLNNYEMYTLMMDYETYIGDCINSCTLANLIVPLSMNDFYENVYEKKVLEVA